MRSAQEVTTEKIQQCVPEQQTDDPYCSKIRPSPSGGPLVEIEQSTQPQPALHPTRHVDYRRTRDQPIVAPLVISFLMIVLDVLRDRTPKVPLPDRNHPIETLFLNRSHEPLRIGVCVGGPLRRHDDAEAGLTKPAAHRPAPFA